MPPAVNVMHRWLTRCWHWMMALRYRCRNVRMGMARLSHRFAAGRIWRVRFDLFFLFWVSFLFFSCADPLLMVSPFMGEFISFVRTKETEPKKNRPVVLACGVSARFSLNRARWTRATPSDMHRALSGPDFQCSTTQKGMKFKTGSETYSWYEIDIPLSRHDRQKTIILRILFSLHSRQPRRLTKLVVTDEARCLKTMSDYFLSKLPQQVFLGRFKQPILVSAWRLDPRYHLIYPFYVLKGITLAHWVPGSYVGL